MPSNDKFSNISGNRINFHKSIGFLDTNHKHIEKEIIDTLAFTIALKKISGNKSNQELLDPGVQLPRRSHPKRPLSHRS